MIQMAHLRSNRCSVDSSYGVTNSPSRKSFFSVRRSGAGDSRARRADRRRRTCRCSRIARCAHCSRGLGRSRICFCWPARTRWRRINGHLATSSKRIDRCRCSSCVASCRTVGSLAQFRRRVGARRYCRTSCRCSSRNHPRPARGTVLTSRRGNRAGARWLICA